MNQVGVDLELLMIRKQDGLPRWLTAGGLARFLHQSLKPYEDTLEEIQCALERVFLTKSGHGGFVLLAVQDEAIHGALVIHFTPWSGYVPENLLLYVAVDPKSRGCGIGRKLIRQALSRCAGDIALHVEYDNPAIRLYDKLGFSSKYAEMRYYS
jgi:ribosomal protein S18 acetylase RimI-like enzyme